MFFEHIVLKVEPIGLAGELVEERRVIRYFWIELTE